MSPGTSSLALTSTIFPSLRTVAVGEESFLSASKAFSAFVSMMVPMIALMTTTAMMMPTSMNCS